MVEEREGAVHADKNTTRPSALNNDMPKTGCSGSARGASIVSHRPCPVFRHPRRVIGVRVRGRVPLRLTPTLTPMSICDSNPTSPEPRNAMIGRSVAAAAAVASVLGARRCASRSSARRCRPSAAQVRRRGCAGHRAHPRTGDRRHRPTGASTIRRSSSMARGSQRSARHRA